MKVFGPLSGSVEGWMLNVLDKIGVTPGPRQTEMSTEPTPISTA